MTNENDEIKVTVGFIKDFSDATGITPASDEARLEKAINSIPGAKTIEGWGRYARTVQLP